MSTSIQQPRILQMTGLKDVQDRTINRIVLTTFIISVFAFSFLAARDLDQLTIKYEQGGFWTDLFLRGLLSIMLLGFASWRRKHLTVRAKIVLISISTAVIFLWGSTSFGLLGASKAVIIFIPILLTVSFSTTVAVSVLLLMVASFLAAGYLFVNEYLEFSRMGGPAEFIANPASWLNHGLLMMAAGLGLRYIASTEEEVMQYSFQKSNELKSELEEAESRLVLYRDNLQQMVAEKTDELEKVNLQMKDLNESLGLRNRQGLRQQSELENILEERQSLEARLVFTAMDAAAGRLSAGMLHELAPLLVEIGGHRPPSLQAGSEHTDSTESSESMSEDLLRMSVLISALNPGDIDTDEPTESFDIVEVVKGMAGFQSAIRPGDFLEPELPGAAAMVKARKTDIHYALYDMFEIAYRRMSEGTRIKVQLLRSEKEVKLGLSFAASVKEATKQDLSPREWEKIALYGCHETFAASGGSLHMTIDEFGRYEWEVLLPISHEAVENI